MRTGLALPVAALLLVACSGSVGANNPDDTSWGSDGGTNADDAAPSDSGSAHSDGGIVDPTSDGGAHPSDAGAADSGVQNNDGGSAPDASGGSCMSAPAWASGVAYSAGDLVTYDGVVYVCLQAHTSEDSWTPSSTPALWMATTNTSCSSGPDASAPMDSGTAPDSSTVVDSGTVGTVPAGFVFSPYKDTTINMNWNTNVISTMVPGAATSLGSDLVASGGKTITLAFATGECGSENWGGVAGAALASANVSLLTQAGAKYIVSTGGAAGSFTCGTDAGMTTFIDRWASSGLVGIDFDIEAGQSASVIQALVARIQTAHGTYPGVRFSLTIATLANNNGGSTAQSLGSGVQDSLNVYGDNVLAAVSSTFGFSASNPSSWPSYLTVDLMTMDYGGASDGVCVVSGSTCQMGQSAIQAAYNLHDHFGVPYANIELTPMLGGNDVSSEQFSLADADTLAHFAVSQGLAGVHYWSYDRDTDCAQGSASSTCNSMGVGYAGAHGYLERFLADGLH
jgi:chitinase